jgi:hypothetical protein
VYLESSKEVSWFKDRGKQAGRSSRRLSPALGKAATLRPSGGNVSSCGRAPATGKTPWWTPGLLSLCAMEAHAFGFRLPATALKGQSDFLSVRSSALAAWHDSENRGITC